MGYGLRSLCVRFRQAGGVTLLVVLLLAGSFRSAIADWNDIPSGSMRPTLLEGDRIYVNKLAYDLRLPFTTWHLLEWNSPRRGDIVIFFSPVDRTRLVKRVVGIPGDVVAMRDNRLLLNGEPVAYEELDAEPPSTDRARRYAEALPGRDHPIQLLPGRAAHSTFGPVPVPPGQYLMLGDNRDNSADSRSFGFVPRHLILGRATAVVASLDLEEHYRPRWERFFTTLQ